MSREEHEEGEGETIQIPQQRLNFGHRANFQHTDYP